MLFQHETSCESLHFILIHLCPINRGNVLYWELYKRSGGAFLHFGPISTCPMFLSCIFGKCNSHNNYKVVQADKPCAVWQLPRVSGGRHREGVCRFIQTEGWDIQLKHPESADKLLCIVEADAWGHHRTQPINERYLEVLEKDYATTFETRFDKNILGPWSTGGVGAESYPEWTRYKGPDTV